MNNIEYINLSLELHLFFDRIMKEHSIFLQLAFTEKEKNFKTIANNFQNVFSNFLNTAITLANNNISNNILSSNEIVTKNTLEAEIKTNFLTKTNINTKITEKELMLRSGNINLSQQLLNNIEILNQQTLEAIKQLIDFKEDILNSVLECKMYTTNYPLLIAHIRNEAIMYYNLLSKVQRKEEFTKSYIYEQEQFWNNIMKEHAEFIRGLLDPSEKQLIITADKFADEYESILSNSNNLETTINKSLNETINFRNFKLAGEEGILNCKIRSIIIPLLADHVLREANHFIRILNEFKEQRNYF